MPQPEKTKDVIRPTDAEAVALAKRLVRTARHGTIAVLEAGTGLPFASRVGVSTARDGAPQIFVSGLSQHTQALAADPRCSLLLGEPGKGDPLAHPRVTLICEAVAVERGGPAHEAALARHLLRHPKAKLYAGLGDFQFFRLEPSRASLNGGFGKAYLLTRADLLAPVGDPALDGLERDLAAAFESGAPAALEIMARLGPGAWRFAGIDAEGVDFVGTDSLVRLDLNQIPGGLDDLSTAIVWPASLER